MASKEQGGGSLARVTPSHTEKQVPYRGYPPFPSIGLFGEVYSIDSVNSTLPKPQARGASETKWKWCNSSNATTAVTHVSSMSRVYNGGAVYTHLLTPPRDRPFHYSGLYVCLHYLVLSLLQI